MDLKGIQFDVVSLYAEGHTRDEISKSLGLSPYTISIILKTAESRLGARSIQDLVAKYYRWKENADRVSLRQRAVNS